MHELALSLERELLEAKLARTRLAVEAADRQPSRSAIRPRCLEVARAFVRAGAILRRPARTTGVFRPVASEETG
jgi:hypothetical protein